MSKLAEFFDAEIPAGRNKLQESHASLLNVASYCEDNYLKAANKAEALAETKHYTTQSLASVAYQINTLANSMLQMLDLQGAQLADMELSTNHLARNVSMHKEKVARREIGLLTTNKNCVRTHKIIAPANPEKHMKNKSVPIDYSLLDSTGHGMKISDSSKVDTIKKQKKSQSSIVRPTLQDNVFPINQPDPDSRPPNSPIECDLYSTVHKKKGDDLPGSPKFVRQYRPSKYAAIGEPPSPPPPPPQDPDMLQGQDMSLPPPMMTLPPMAPPPPPLPGVDVDAKRDTPGRGGAPGGKKYDMMMMPPPPPPDMMVMPPPEMEASSIPPPPLMEATLYPANMGITDEEMPPPPEFVQTADVDVLAPAEYMEKVIAIYGYEKNLEDELTFQEDDIIYVLQKNPNGWYEGVLNGVTGLFPGNYVQTVP